MRTISFLVLFIASIPLALLSPLTAEASPPNVMAIVREMQEVFEPERASIRKIEISVSDEKGLYTRWVARRVSKTFPEGKRTLLVLLDPPDVRGNALLVQERKGKPSMMWVYLPVVRRVREIIPVRAYESFLDTDFTYADLGLLDYSGTYRLLGEEDRSGEKTYKIEFKPKNTWYYSRVVTWVSKDSHLPLERDYYDVSGKLWKKETFEQVALVDGIPTPFRIVMKDVQDETQSVFEVSEVRSDIDIPDDLVTPEALSRAADSPFWKDLESAIPVPSRSSWAPCLPPPAKSASKNLVRNMGSHPMPQTSHISRGG